MLKTFASNKSCFIVFLISIIIFCCEVYSSFQLSNGIITLLGIIPYYSMQVWQSSPYSTPVLFSLTLLLCCLIYKVNIENLSLIVIVVSCIVLIAVFLNIYTGVTDFKFPSIMVNGQEVKLELRLKQIYSVSFVCSYSIIAMVVCLFNTKKKKLNYISNRYAERRF